MVCTRGMLSGKKRKRVDEEKHTSPPQVTKKNSKKFEIDRSKLNDDIIRSILTHMPIKHITRVGLLSRRWKCLSSSITELKFTNKSVFAKDVKDFMSELPSDLTRKRAFLQRRTRKFINYVEKILSGFTGTGINNFELMLFLYGANHRVHVDRWIDFALTHNTRNLSIRLSSEGFCLRVEREQPLYEFPCQLLDKTKACYLLEKCVLEKCLLRPTPAFHGFDSLKTLHLMFVKISEVHLHRLMYRCARLEELVVAECQDLVNFTLHEANSNIKHLTIRSCKNLLNITLSSACLTYFDYYGRVVRIFYVRNQVAQLSKVSLFFLDQENTPDMEYMVDQFSQVETMTLRFRGQPNNLVIGSLSPQIRNKKFSKLRHLVINIGVEVVHAVDLLSLSSCILNESPLLEKFLVQVIGGGGYEKEVGRAIRRPFKCPHKYLKEFQLNNFKLFINQIELLTYIVNNAVNLESLIIDRKGFLNVGIRQWLRLDAAVKYENSRWGHDAYQQFLREIPQGVKLLQRLYFTGISHRSD